MEKIGRQRSMEKMLQRSEKESLGLLAGLADGWKEAQVESHFRFSVFVTKVWFLTTVSVFANLWSRLLLQGQPYDLHLLCAGGRMVRTFNFG